MDAQEKKPKVSVCVVTYNQEMYIRQCLQSIVDQDVDFNFELIVSDDCSTDTTRTIIQEFAEKYPNLLKPTFHKKNIGAFKNYAFVHNQANGEYISHMDGDDFWFPEKLKSQVTFMESNKECVAVYSNALVVAGDNQVVGTFSCNVKPIFDSNYLIKDGNFLCHSSMMYRANLRENIFSIPGDYIDFHVHLKLSEIGQLGHIDKNLAAYRSDSSDSIVKMRNNYIRSLYLKALLDVDASKTELTSINNALAKFLAEAMNYELFNGSFLSYKNWLILIKSDASKNVYKIQILAFPGFFKIVLIKSFNRIRNLFKRKISKKYILYRK